MTTTVDLVCAQGCNYFEINIYFSQKCGVKVIFIKDKKVLKEHQPRQQQQQVTIKHYRSSTSLSW